MLANGPAALPQYPVRALRLSKWPSLKLLQGSHRLTKSQFSW
jgi:hypothetical protein